MEFALGDSQQRFLDDLRSYLDELDVSGVVAEMENDELEIGPEGRLFMKRLGKDGWLGVAWPERYGGRGLSALEQWLFVEEMDYRRLPVGDLSMLSVGPMIIRSASEEQKQRYLPGMLKGEIHFAGGYTEPNAGSDLASLRTRAVRDGDDYVINGEKIFTTAAHYATHIWLAARTGEQEDRHRAISLFIVPVNADGVTIRPLETQAGWRTNQVFFDGVRIPAANMVGEQGQGWYIIAKALDLERLMPFSRLARELDEVIAWALEHGLLDNSAVRARLAENAVDVEVARLLAMRTAWMISEGEVPNAEASMFKVWRSLLRQRIAIAGVDLMGEEALPAFGSSGASLGGRPERAYRASPLLKFGGGAIELQKNIIAQRGLGLPRP
jgi:hypothetical protein